MLFVTLSLKGMNRWSSIGLHSCRTANPSRKGSGCKAQKVRLVGRSAGADEGVSGKPVGKHAVSDTFRSPSFQVTPYVLYPLDIFSSFLCSQAHSRQCTSCLLITGSFSANIPSLTIRIYNFHNICF